MAVEIGQSEGVVVGSIAASEFAAKIRGNWICRRRYLQRLARTMSENQPQRFFGDALGDGVNGVFGGDDDYTDSVFGQKVDGGCKTVDRSTVADESMAVERAHYET